MLESLITMMGILVPPVIYALIMWVTLPYGTIKLRDAAKFLIFGGISIVLLRGMWAIAPGWFDDAWTMGLFAPVEDYWWTKSFLKVAWPEELSKYIALFLISRVTFGKNHEHHPIGMMFYGAMVGLSFGLFENMGYIVRYGSEILPIRTVLPLVMHMLAGVGMGYFIALGRYAGKIKGRSILSIIMYNNKWLCRLLYGFIGVIFSSAYHGLYNYGLLLNDFYASTYAKYGLPFGDQSYPVMFTLLGLGLVGAYAASRHLTYLSSKHNHN